MAGVLGVDAAGTRPVIATGIRRWRLAVVAAVMLAAVTVLAIAGLQGTLVYYRTPTGLVRDRAQLVGAQVRVGGLVQVGTLHRSGSVVTFVLTDGATSIPVRFVGPINGVFAAGRDALVDGRLTRSGIFDGDQLMVKHDSSYRGPDRTPPTVSAAGQR